MRMRREKMKREEKRRGQTERGQQERQEELPATYFTPSLVATRLHGE
jgi:hypothetical protein